MSEFRIEKDSLGECKVPVDALYAAQTQRAVENFPISGLTLPKAYLNALLHVKAAAAEANQTLGLLDREKTKVIVDTCTKLQQSPDFLKHFPLDIFQTGSGTSTNMNANEVISGFAKRFMNVDIHPNDHVNMSQSSNDVIPSTIHVSSAIEVQETLLPALKKLAACIEARSTELKDVTKTGRTHLMDAMPVTFGQELSGWALQIRHGIERLNATMPRLLQLGLGGTAVGTGINAHVDYAKTVCGVLKQRLKLDFSPNDNFFESLSCQDAIVELSGQCKTIAVSLMKIANDLRWMNSGPLAGLAEIALPALQPGSSIMPGKVNPVIPEAMAMVCAKVVGNDASITIGGQSGNFQLNVMLPMIAYCMLESIHILGNAATLLADKAIAGFTVQKDNIEQALYRNPILVTALNRVIGYELGAKIAKRAYAEKRSVIDVALEETSLSREELEKILEPKHLTKGGV